MAWWATQRGTGPVQAGSALALNLQSAGHLTGGVRPRAGSRALCQALRRLIAVSTQAGECFETSGCVVSSIDVGRLFLGLLGEGDVPRGLAGRVEQVSVASAPLLKIDLVLAEVPVFERHGSRPEQTIASPVLAPSWDYVRDAWADIAAGRPAEGPALWSACPMALDVSLAPEGGHTLWLAPFAPFALSGGRSWDEAKQAVAHRAEETFCRYAPNTRDAIPGRLVTSPWTGNG